LRKRFAFVAGNDGVGASSEIVARCTNGLHGLFHIPAADPFQLNAGWPSPRHQIA